MTAVQLAGQRLDLTALGLLAIGLVGLAVALPQVMPPGFLRLRRGLSAIVLVRGLLPGAFFGSEAFLPLMLVEQRGVGLTLAGAVLTVGSVGWTVGSWLQSRVWVPLRRDRFITVGCLCLAAGIGLIAMTAARPGLWVGLVGLGWVVAGLGMGLSMASANLAAMTLSRATEQGRIGSALNLSDAVGAAIFIGLGGTLFAMWQPGGALGAAFGSVHAVMALVAVTAVVVSLRIGPVRNAVTEPAAALEARRTDQARRRLPG